MRLFQMDLDTFELTIAPEVLAIKEFAQIIKRDSKKGRPTAMAELAYIWFFTDFRSDFVQIIDDDERTEEIKDALISLTRDWKPDELVLSGIERYKSLSRSVTSRMLEDARSIVDNMSKYARDASLHLDEVIETKFGEKPKYDMGKIQSFITAVPKLLETLSSLEEKVLRERDLSEAHRGSQEKALFEDEQE